MQLKDKYDSWVYKHTPSELQDMYRPEIQLNRHRLEKESQKQASIFEKWYSALEDVEADLRDAMKDLSDIRSEVDLIVRSRDTSLKEGGITSKININKKVKLRTKRVNDIKRYQSKLKGAVESAKQRKSMITVLKDLYVANYWDQATPSGTPMHGRRIHKTKRAE